MITVYDVKGDDGSVTRCKDSSDARCMEQFYRIHRRARNVTITPVEVDQLHKQRVTVWLKYLYQPEHPNPFFNIDSIPDATVYDLAATRTHTYGKIDLNGETFLVQRRTWSAHCWHLVDPDQFG